MYKKLVLLLGVTALFACNNSGYKPAEEETFKNIPETWTIGEDQTYTYRADAIGDLEYSKRQLIIGEIDPFNDYVVEFELSRTGGTPDDPYFGLLLNWDNSLTYGRYGYELGVGYDAMYSFTTNWTDDTFSDNTIMLDRGHATMLNTDIGSVNRVKVEFTASLKEFKVYLNDSLADIYIPQAVAPGTQIGIWTGELADTEPFPLIVTYKRLQ